MRGTGVAMVATGLFGGAVGVAAFTFVYAKGASYLSSNPAVCANCHIMQEHFDAWQRSSHRAVAGCADCHMPHQLIGKYVSKASNGFWHSLAFTTGAFPDPLQIKPHNRAITERACRDCHTAIVAAIDPVESEESIGIGAALAGSPSTARPQIHDGPIEARRESCIRCHTYVGHLVR